MPSIGQSLWKGGYPRSQVQKENGRVSHSKRSESKNSVLDIARQLCFPPLWRTLGQVQWWYGGPAMLQRGGSPGGSKSPDTFFSKGQMRIKPSSQNLGVIDGILWYWPRFVGIHQNPRLPEAHGHLRLWPGRILRRGGHVFILWDRRSSHPWVQHGAVTWVVLQTQMGWKVWTKTHNPSILSATFRVSPTFIIFRQSLTTPNGWAYHRPKPIPKLHPPQLPTGSRTRAGTTWQASLLSSSDWSWSTSSENRMPLNPVVYVVYHQFPS